MEEIPARRGSSDDGNLSKCTRYTLVQWISQIRRHHRSAAAISLAGASSLFVPGTVASLSKPTTPPTVRGYNF